MQQKYQGSTKVKRVQLQALRREFDLLTMKEGEKVDSFLGRTLHVVNSASLAERKLFLQMLQYKLSEACRSEFLASNH